jgi:membrane peptidoglycan carboxypeptidase
MSRLGTNRRHTGRHCPGQSRSLADERRPLSTPPTRSSQHAGKGNAKGRPARKGWRRAFSWKRILLTMLGLFVLGGAVFGVAYATTNVPQPNDLASAQASIIYYADGKTEMARISAVNRESVPLTQIPLHVQRALLAAEDRTFYQNNGVSPTGIARAVVVALKGGPTQGGSTITQQYVKNYFLTQDRTVSRKAREFIISIKIDQQESKNTILANYLNTIYYGRGAYGIQTAAKAYFGVDVSKLSVAQGALLAAVIRGPEFYDPALGPRQVANATARVKYVLDGMVSEGWLSPAERARTTFPKTKSRPKISRSGTTGYITNEVRIELTNKLGLKDTDIERGGLRIVTTIDKGAQESAVNAVNDKMPSERDAKNLHVGLTAIRPGDGAIVAMYGGKDYGTAQLNTSTDATMQGGSTFKVFGLLAALQKDISTRKRYAGYSPRFFSEFKDTSNPTGRVKNFGNEQFSRLDLRRALAHSVNTVFAQLNIDLAAPGTNATGVRDAAILAGLPKACPGPGRARTCTPGLGTNMTNIFGTASPHVIDMANAYATVAAHGQRATPYLIAKVTSANGNISYRAKKELTRVFDPKVTADVTEAMTHVVTEGTGRGALALGRPAAGKTGTTTDNKAVWFDGFTPQLCAAVGVYQGDGTGTIKVTNINEVTGGGLPVDIWTAFMKGALQGKKVLDFPSRSGVGDSAVPTPTQPPTFAPTTSAPPTTPPPPTSAPPTTAPTTSAQPTTAPPTRAPRPTFSPSPTRAPLPTVPPQTPAAGGIRVGGGPGPPTRPAP